MLQINTHGIYESTLLTSCSVRHGYSTKLGGDTRDVPALAAVLHTDGWTKEQYTGAQQIHGAVVAVVDTSRMGSEIIGADGLVTTIKGSVIGVKTADCVPLLLADPDEHVVSAVHAGWKGTIAGIASDAVRSMESEGARVANIRVSIGPSIGACCYTVPHERAALFMERFGKNSGVVSEVDTVWHLDLGKANELLLLERGILPHLIEMSGICTSCQSDKFYSYRKNKDRGFGEMVSFIGI